MNFNFLKKLAIPRNINIFCAILFISVSSYCQLSDTYYTKQNKLDSLIANDKNAWEINQPSFFLYHQFQLDSVLEYWYFNPLPDSSFTLKITYAYNNTYYVEKYSVYKGELINSYEEETMYEFGSNAKGQGLPWQGTYYWENNKIVLESTNGHGKSEIDDWDPSKENWNRYQKRIKQLF